MAKKKYDWVKLKNEYLRSPHTTATSFLRDSNISINGYVANMVTGWRREKTGYKKALEQSTDKKVVAQLSNDVAKVRVRQAKIARNLQTKGLMGMIGQKVSTVEQARKLILTGLEQERSALGLDKPSMQPSGDINVTLIQTRFGQSLNNLDYGQLIAILEKLEQLDQRGAKGLASGGKTQDIAQEAEIVED